MKNRVVWRSLVVVGACLPLVGAQHAAPLQSVMPGAALTPQDSSLHALNRLAYGPRPGDVPRVAAEGERRVRSEEHTSELQSLAYLVCRLLLEKKNQHASMVGSFSPKRCRCWAGSRPSCRIMRKPRITPHGRTRSWPSGETLPVNEDLLLQRTP